MSTPVVAKKKSLLRGSDHFVAQTVTINMGTEAKPDLYHFEIRELSASARETIDDFPTALSMAIGCPEEIFSDGEEFDKWYAQNKRIVLDEETGETIRQRMETMVEQNWNIALLDALVTWTLPEKMTEETIPLLPKVLKNKLFRIIQAGSSSGVGAENFFR